MGKLSSSIAVATILAEELGLITYFWPELWRLYCNWSSRLLFPMPIISTHTEMWIITLPVTCFLHVTFVCLPNAYRMKSKNLNRIPQWLSRRLCLQRRRPRFDPWVRKIPWRRTWQPTLVLLSGEPHGQRSLLGWSPQGCTESDTSEATKQQQRENFTATISWSMAVLQTFRVISKDPNTVNKDSQL